MSYQLIKDVLRPLGLLPLARRMYRTWSPVLFGRRIIIPFGYYRRLPSNIVRWLFWSRESSNFTYDLDELNLSYLASMISLVTGKDYDTISSYIQELGADEELKRHVRNAAETSSYGCVGDAHARFGRRVGWYALVRAMKPRVVVETGVDKGLGACVITSALQKNSGEGFHGRYYGTDIDPGAGVLFQPPYTHYGAILYGDSIGSLKSLNVQIDLFINDSDHSAEYEYREYQTIAANLSTNGIVVADNAHVTGKLLAFARESGRRFLFFQEKPKHHWYPGAGMGISF